MIEPQNDAARSDTRAEQSTDGCGRITWFAYVRHEDRASREAQGWRYSADLGPHHGFYCILMERDDAPE